MTLLCCYRPGSRAGLLGCLQPHCTLAHSSSTSAGLLSGLLEHCTRKQIPRKQTLSLGNWNAVGSNKQTLCNEDLGLCSCQQVQQVLHIKSSLDLLAPKREMPQRSCHLSFHMVPPFPASHHPPPLSLPLARMYFHPLLISEEHIPLLSNWKCRAPEHTHTVWEGVVGGSTCLQGSGSPSPSAGVSAAQLSRSQSDTVPGQDAALEEHTWAVCTPQAIGNPLWVIPPQTPGAGPYLQWLAHLTTANMGKLSWTAGSLLAKDTGSFQSRLWYTLVTFFKYSSSQWHLLKTAQKMKKFIQMFLLLVKLLTSMPLQMEFYESAQHGSEWIARPQHNAQIPSAPPMSFVLESL